MRASRIRSRTAFSLLELIVALSVMTILMGGMASAVLVATKAMPAKDSGSSTGPAKVRRLANRISGDLALTTEFILMNPGIVEFWVPDRGHGADGPEKMRYEWTGTPGDPLTLRYNDSLDVTLYEDVYEFSLEYSRTAMPLLHTPRVLMIVGDDTTPDAQDQARRAQIESWGFGVEILDPFAGDAAYTSALADADVMYWSEQHTMPPPWWVFDAGRGIVCEKRDSLDVLGISKGSNWHWFRELQIVDNTHEITRVFPLGPIQIFSTDGYGIISTQTIAPDGKILGNNSGYDIMVAVEVGGALNGGKTAPARRVSMPWGDRDFDFTTVTTDGLTIMRRAIVWAAAPIGVGEVRLTLQIGPDTSHRVETTVVLLNQPEWP